MMMMIVIDWEDFFKKNLGVDEWVFCWRCWCWCWCLVLILDMEFYNIGRFTFFFRYGIWFGMVWYGWFRTYLGFVWIIKKDGV